MSVLVDAGSRVGELPRPFFYAVGVLSLVALALVSPIAAVAALGVIVVVLGAIWLEVGFTIYLVSLHFVLFVRRFFESQPVGLVLDGALMLMLFGLLLRLSKPDCTERRRWQHPIVAAVLIFKGFQFINAF